MFDSDLTFKYMSSWWGDFAHVILRLRFLRPFLEFCFDLSFVFFSFLFLIFYSPNQSGETSIHWQFPTRLTSFPNFIHFVPAYAPLARKHNGLPVEGPGSADVFIINIRFVPWTIFQTYPSHWDSSTLRQFLQAFPLGDRSCSVQVRAQNRLRSLLCMFYQTQSGLRFKQPL